MSAAQSVGRTFGTVDLVVCSHTRVARLSPNCTADIRHRRTGLSVLTSLDEVQAALSSQLDRERRGLPFAADQCRALHCVLREFSDVF